MSKKSQRKDFKRFSTMERSHDGWRGQLDKHFARRVVRAAGWNRCVRL